MTRLSSEIGHLKGSATDSAHPSSGMADTPDLTPPDEAPVAPPPTAPRKSFLRRHWGKVLITLILATPPLVFLIWAIISLSWSYSEGQRVGYVQKISRKGFICKTWEGTLYTDIAKGFRSDSFNFTVRDDSLAKVIEGLSGKKVSIYYQQHIKVPSSCFGDTEYFVKKADALPE
jgi:hypothetical protein